MSFRLSILSWVMWDDLPFMNFLYCHLCLLTQLPSLKKCWIDLPLSRFREQAKVMQTFCTYSGLSLYRLGTLQSLLASLYSTSCDSRRSNASRKGSQIKPMSLRISILSWVTKDDLPSMNLLCCHLWVLTHLPSLKEILNRWSLSARVKSKMQGDIYFQHLLWIVRVCIRNITIAMCLLICTQLRKSKVKSILQRIPAKANIIETVDSILSHLGLPSMNFLYCTLWVLTHLPSLNEILWISRYQHVESKEDESI